MADSRNIDVTRLTLLGDDHTPYDFVIGLLEEVFGKSNTDAKLIAATAHHYGEADCGLWPDTVADALLGEAKARIDTAGHSLAFARTTAKGREGPGHETCGFCGKPASQVKLLYRGEAARICDACVLRGANHLSQNVAGTSYSFAYEVLNWHFAGIGRDRIETSVRNFPARMRADLQLAVDEIFPPNTIRQLGIKSGYRFETVEFTNLWDTGRSAQSIVPVQFTEIDVGEEAPRRCVGTALWLLSKDDFKHAALVSQVEGMRGDSHVRVEIAAPQGEAGAQISAQYFRRIEDIINQARSYRGKVLSLETGRHWDGLTGGITVHRLPQVRKKDVILPVKTLRLLNRNVIEFATQRDQLRAIGQPAKKGLLFYGPPGTGKTHTIQYLASRLTGHTTLLVTAEQVVGLSEYFSLARLLQPSMLVIEDADLIAREREHMTDPAEEVLLNKLLNEMDGLRQDADIFFVLTTNRPEQLEAALASRPGRIDQAIEFPLPDKVGRKKLVRLYSGGLSVPADVLTETVQRTEGVSGAFIKELMRRTAQYVFEREDGTHTVTRQDIESALDEMLFEGGRLNATLLGGPERSE